MEGLAGGMRVGWGGPRSRPTPSPAPPQEGGLGEPLPAPSASDAPSHPGTATSPSTPCSQPGPATLPCQRRHPLGEGAWEQ